MFGMPSRRDGGRRKGREFHCSVGEREARELPRLVPGALELGECRGGPGEDFTTPAPGAKWLGFKRHLIHVSRHAEPTGRARGYYSNCTPRCVSECRVMSGLVRQVEQSGRRIEVKVG